MVGIPVVIVTKNISGPFNSRNHRSVFFFLGGGGVGRMFEFYNFDLIL